MRRWEEEMMTAPHQWKVLVLPLTLTRGDVSSLCSITELFYFLLEAVQG